MLPPEPVGDDKHQWLAGHFPCYLAVIAMIEIVAIALQIHQLALFSTSAVDHDGYAIHRILQIQPALISLQNQRWQQRLARQRPDQQLHQLRVSRGLTCLLDAVTEGDA
ncbi:hypothetical protein D3C85_1627730 [compost metagenome]